MELTLLRTAIGLVVHPDDRDGQEFLRKVKPGTVMAGDIRQRRNIKFHRKFMALCRVAYDYWEETMPQQDYKGEQVKPEFERFRHDLTILAGFYEAVFAIDGSVKLKSKSISFASMDEEEFGRVYNKVLDTVLGKIMRNVSKEELEAAVEQIMGFAS